MSNNKSNNNFNDLQKTITRLKSENISLKDQILITKQENIALNNVRIESIKCIEVLNKIVEQLVINHKNEEKEKVEESNEEQSDRNIEYLRSNYELNYSQLNEWFKQLDIIKSINKYPRFEVIRYKYEKRAIRRSKRVTLPVDHFSPFAIDFQNEKESIMKCDETPILSSNKTKNSSISVTRLRCPFPGCGFKTKRGAIGLKEHSILHTKSYNNINDNEMESKPIVANVKSKGKRVLRCSYPDCVFTTTYGMYNLRRHMNNVHKKKSPKKSNISPQKGVEVNGSGVKSKTVLHCSYTDCNYETIWGMSKLRIHMKTHITHKQINFKNKSNANTKHMGNVLRCTKCNYKTKWGLSVLKRHLRIHDREQPFKCDSCDASFGSINLLNSHKILIHQNVVIVKEIKKTNRKQCDVCNKTFKDSYGLRRHRKIHDKTSYECPHTQCLFKTNIMAIFQKHVVTHILIERKPEDILIEDSNSQEFTPKVEIIEPKKEKKVLAPFEIPEEINSELKKDKESKMSNIGVFNFGSHLMKNSINKDNEQKRITRNSLKSINEEQNGLSESTSNVESIPQIETPITNRLIETLMKNPKPFDYVCDAHNCSFTSNNVEEWIKHNDKHEEEDKANNLKCDFCKRTFNKMSRLEAHKRLKGHIFQKCLVNNCGQQFKSFQLLQKHSISSHQKSLKSLSLLNTPEVTEKKFVCNFNNCNESFTTDYIRKLHIKNVHNERSFASKSTTSQTRVRSETVTHWTPETSHPVLASMLAKETAIQLPSDTTHPLLATMLRTEIDPKKLNELNVMQNNIKSFDIKCAVITCKQVFVDKKSMISHFNKSHRQFLNHELINISDGMSRCPDCGLLFELEVNMRRHRTLAHKHYKSGVFSSENSFNTLDTNYTQFKEKSRFQCQRTGCGKWFDSALSLREHLNLEHNKNINNNNTVIYEESCYENPIKCDVCDIHFTTDYEFEEHFKTFHEFQQQMPSIDTDLDISPPLNQNLFSDALSFEETTDLFISPTFEQQNEDQNMEILLTTIKAEQY